MDAIAVIAAIGGIALLLGIFGGGIKAKEVDIPILPVPVRILSSVIGTILIGTAIWLSSRNNIISQEPLTEIPTSISSPQISEVTAPPASTVLVSPSATDNPQFSSPVQDIRVRQAIAFCTDRHALTRSVYPSLTSVEIDDLTMDSFLLKIHWAYSQPNTQYPFDPAAGQVLLEQAGWTWLNGKNYRTNSRGEELSLKLTTTPLELRQTWGAVFEAQMQACGIHLIRLHVDPSWWFGETTGAIRGDFELGALYWDIEENPDVNNFYGCDSIPTSENDWKGNNLAGWCNQTASEAAKKATDLSLSQAERKQFFAILQEEFARDLPALPLFLRTDANGWEHIEFNLGR